MVLCLKINWQLEDARGKRRKHSIVHCMPPIHQCQIEDARWKGQKHSIVQCIPPKPSTPRWNKYINQNCWRRSVDECCHLLVKMLIRTPSAEWMQAFKMHNKFEQLHATYVASHHSWTQQNQAAVTFTKSTPFPCPEQGSDFLRKRMHFFGEEAEGRGARGWDIHWRTLHHLV